MGEDTMSAASSRPSAPSWFSFRHKLHVAFGLFFLFLMLVTGGGLWSLLHLRTVVQQAVEVDGRLSRLSSQVAIQALLCRRYEKDFFLNIGDGLAEADYSIKWDTAAAGLDQAIQAFGTTATTAEDRQQVLTWQTESLRYQQAFAQLRQVIGEQQITDPAQANSAITPFKDTIRTLTDSATGTAQRKNRLAQAAEGGLEQQLTPIISLAVVVTVLAALVALSGALLLPAWLIRPIDTLRTTADRLAAGDLAVRASVQGDDELGALARSFNQMAGAIQQYTEQLQVELAERTHAEALGREREAYFRALIEQSADVIALFAADGTIVYGSPATTRILGYAVPEFVGRSAFDLIHPEDRPQIAQHLTWLIGQPRASLSVQARVQHVDGSWRDLEGMLTNLLDDPAVGAIVNNYRDITERKRAEAVLAEERASLAQRVEERTADLSAANADLARAARLKDEFLASMSHELRTPLNTILGMAETVQEGVLGSINDEQTDALRHIEESGRHLLSLINDILDLSKVEAGKLDLNVEEVELVVVAQASLRLISELARQKKLHMVSSIDSTVSVLQADARRLKQMLVNLLSNAVKFTPEGGTIGLEVVGDAAAQLVRLTVWDTGIGIADDDLPRLFQSFVQLDSRLARHYTGTGLGLALVERMAAVHGGSVAVESVLGQGTRFTITLPWTATPPTAASVASVDRAALPVAARARIQRALVIDDSPPAAAQLVRYLRELGAEASVHPCGVGALEVALDVCPDVILLDIQLPDRSGWEVLAQLKADERVRAIPVVVVSVVDDRAHALALGAAAYLVKPISRQQLQDALDTLPSGGVFHTLHSALTVAPPPSPATPAPIILLAEDEENNIYTLSTYLEAKGYQVVVARNGAEALSRADDAKPALILMDIQMPGMDGLEAIQRIRADSGLRQVPIIALTALAMPGDRERCLAVGANEYLSKPVSLKGLVTTIEAHLQHAGASREAICDAY
jgi:PAS domain S-box-containing protein